MKKQHVPFLIEKIINNKNTTLQRLFNLEQKPCDVYGIDDTSKTIKELKNLIKYSLNDCKDIIKNCEYDFIEDVKESTISLDGNVYDMETHIDELVKTVNQWEDAYSSLESLLLEILNKENIDLSKYSVNMTDSELKIYNRRKKITNLLGN